MPYFCIRRNAVQIRFYWCATRKRMQRGRAAAQLGYHSLIPHPVKCERLLQFEQHSRPAILASPHANLANNRADRWIRGITRQSPRFSDIDCDAEVYD